MWCTGPQWQLHSQDADSTLGVGRGQLGCEALSDCRPWQFVEGGRCCVRSELLCDSTGPALEYRTRFFALPTSSRLPDGSHGVRRCS